MKIYYSLVFKKKEKIVSFKVKKILEISIG